MGSPSYVWSVVDRNVIMRHMTVVTWPAKGNTGVSVNNTTN